MTPKEKAEELVENYKPYVYPFVGSSYMTGDEYPEQILRYAKTCALLAVGEVIRSKPNQPDYIYVPVVYWQEVKQEIEKL